MAGFPASHETQVLAEKGDGRILWLDLFRGAASLAVCAGHLRNALFVDYAALAPRKPWQAGFYFLTSLGHDAVIVFFVLSGYLIGGGILAQGSAWSLRRYSTARITRLWTVLLPALIFTALVDCYLRTVMPEVLAGHYSLIWHSGPDSDYSASWRTLVGNVFFAQTISVPVFGSNSPLWSLSNEFWYYVLFPSLAVALGCLGTRRGILCRLIALGMAAGVLGYVPHSYLGGFVVWLLGALVWWRGRGKFRALNFPGRVAMGLVGTVTFLGALAATKLTSWGHAKPVCADLLLGGGFSVLVLCVLVSQLPAIWNPAVALLAKGVSEISFTLYLVHFPLVMLIASARPPQSRLIPAEATCAAFGGWLLAIVAFASLWWWIFERNTPRVRRGLGRWLDRLGGDRATGGRSSAI